MRLLELKSLKIKEFFQPPEYVILSHRWTEEEVTYEEFKLVQDFHSGLEPSWFQSKVNKIEDKFGFKKIVKFCRHASQESSCQYGWIDTCCIDKKSSAELSEAINSMYKWYSNSKACFVLLSDVRPFVPGPVRNRQSGRHFDPGKAHREYDSQRSFWTKPAETGEKAASANLHAWLENFRSSSWFGRCWTLQELLAPHKLVLFDGQWSKICGLSKSLDVEQLEPSCVGFPVGLERLDFFYEISKATGIHRNVLNGTSSSRYISISQRMSWAAHRVATREEDIAYSLLGILDINMPLLYGEGSKAFLRLQQELIQSSDDETILGWNELGGAPNVGAESQGRPGILAPHPRYFARSAELKPMSRSIRPVATADLRRFPGSFGWRKIYGVSRSCLQLSSEFLRAFYNRCGSKLLLRAVILPLRCSAELRDQQGFHYLALTPSDQFTSIDCDTKTQVAECLQREEFYRWRIFSWHSSLDDDTSQGVPESMLPSELQGFVQYRLAAVIRVKI